MTWNKAAVALAAAFTEALSLGVLPDSVKPYSMVITAFLAALGVYVVPNAAK